MAEWTKARDSKSRIPKGIGGSNPSLSVSTFGGIDVSDKQKDYSDERVNIPRDRYCVECSKTKRDGKAIPFYT